MTALLSSLIFSAFLRHFGVLRGVAVVYEYVFVGCSVFNLCLFLS
jgi:hypothetical protein